MPRDLLPSIEVMLSPTDQLTRAERGLHARPGGVTEVTTEIELSLVIPTFRERGNIDELVRRLDHALSGIRWELTFVDDDSDDGTAEAARRLARQDPRIRCIQRIGRRGLSSACIEGLLSSSAPVLLVMDADLQHDEKRIPAMLAELLRDGTDLVIASRYVDGAGASGFEQGRASMSRFATSLSRIVCRRDVTDPMSGFFMMRRAVLESTVHRLSAIGFKILLDIMASSPRPLVIREVPYAFRDRFAGASKLDSVALWEFVMLLADKSVGRFVPVRFVSFGIVGGAGVVVHMVALTLLLKALGAEFAVAQACATFTAMLFNFGVNNALTYRDRRLHGWRIVRGFLTFALACGIGAFANVGIAAYLFEARGEWILAALAGIAVSAVWNYGVTQVFTWGDFPRRA